MKECKYYTYNGIVYAKISTNSLNTCYLMLGLTRNTLKSFPIDFVETNFTELLDNELVRLLYINEIK